MTTHGDASHLFVELGLAIVGLAILARVASRWGFSSIPLYLLAGLAFGNGGLAPLHLSQDFIRIGAEIGVLLLLFMLGVEYNSEDLAKNLRLGLTPGIADFLLNFTPGFVFGLALGWKPLAAALLGGATYNTSAGITAKILAEFQQMANPETPLVLSMLVIEDLAMAVYLPLVGVLIAGGGAVRISVSVLVAVVAVAIALFCALRYGHALSRFAAHESDEIVLLTTFGVVLLVAGIAQRFQVSAAIGAFLVGIAASGPIAEQAHRLVAPLRDLFAAMFFFFFALEIDPASLLPVLPLAAGLAAITAGTKIATGYWAARRAGFDQRSRVRAGMALVAHGEFSIVIAGLGVGLQPELGPLSAAYVLMMAILAPFLMRAAK
jgi:CPA2 family monovalent cation:H+ antiporter-2